jgi:hypothetical protein
MVLSKRRTAAAILEGHSAAATWHDIGPEYLLLAAIEGQMVCLTDVYGTINRPRQRGWQRLQGRIQLLGLQRVSDRLV